MKMLKPFLITIVIFASAADAWKEVGNCAGISEQNILFAKDNSGPLLEPLWSNPSLGEEKAYLKSFVQNLTGTNLVFDYEENSPGKVFQISGADWTLYAKNLLVYDQDGNESLNLQESLLLMLEAYRSQIVVSEQLFAKARESLSRFLQTQEKTLILISEGHRLQWSQYSVHGVNSYILFYPDTETLSLEAKDFEKALCDGAMTDFAIYAPFIKASQKDEKQARLLLGARAQGRCQGQVFRKDLLVEIEISKADSAMKLVGVGVQD